MGDLFLHFEGPFTFTDGDRCIFRSPLANSPGIYLWTVRQRLDDTYLIHYVGETNRFGVRHQDHLIQMLGFNYGIFDAEKARDGVCEILWKGLWRDHTAEALARTAFEYQRLHEAVVRYLGVVHVFFVKTEIKRSIRRHVEGCIGLNLRNNHSECKQLYPDDNHVAIMKKKHGLLHITAAEPIRGLDSSIPY